MNFAVHKDYLNSGLNSLSFVFQIHKEDKQKLSVSKSSGAFFYLVLFVFTDP